jgi:hypothetical protein
MPRKNSAITNTNTNTNINKININIPKPTRARQKKQTQSQVDQAELNLANLENMDGRFVNPSIYGFNQTPLYIPEPIQQVQNRVVEQPSRVSRGTMTLEEEEEQLREPESQGTSPISFSSASPVQAEVFSPRPVMAPVDKSGFISMGRGLQLPSDFQARLARQEGFQPTEPLRSPFSMYQNPNLSEAILRRTSMQTGPDINELRTRMFGVKEAGASSSKPLMITEGTSAMPMPEPKGKGGRPKGSKNKPKPTTIETQTGASLNPEPKAVPKAKAPKVVTEQNIASQTGTLRGRRTTPAEEVD